MNLYHDIALQPKEGVFHAIVEIPKDSKVKYEFDHELGTVFVDRIFRTACGYPQNYGFFPRTWNKYDKDPMDVIIFSNETFAPGVVVPVRIVGIIEMDDTGELDHKILAVPVKEAAFDGVKDIADIPQELLGNLEWFLANYKNREPGKEVKLLGNKDSAAALAFIQECEEEYNKQD